MKTEALAKSDGDSHWLALSTKCGVFCKKMAVTDHDGRNRKRGERMRKNEMKLEFDSRSCNEGFARVAVAAFLTQLNPTLEEVADVKTAVSEAVTNVIIHAYDREEEKVLVHCWIEDETLWIEVIDH